MARAASSFSASATSADGDRFLKRRVGSHVDLISVAKLISNPTAGVRATSARGLTPPSASRSRSSSLNRRRSRPARNRHSWSRRSRVCTSGRVCLPGDAVSASHSDVEFYPDERHAPVYEKFLRAGTYQGWKELVSLSQGNSRLLFAYQLAFSGLVCAAFGLDPPGALFCGPRWLGQVHGMQDSVGRSGGGTRRPAPALALASPGERKSPRSKTMPPVATIRCSSSTR